MNSSYVGVSPVKKGNKKRTSIVPAAGLLIVNVLHFNDFFTFFCSMPRI